MQYLNIYSTVNIEVLNSSPGRSANFEFVCHLSVNFYLHHTYYQYIKLTAISQRFLVEGQDDKKDILVSKRTGASFRSFFDYTWDGDLDNTEADWMFWREVRNNAMKLSKIKFNIFGEERSKVDQEATRILIKDLCNDY